MNNSPFSPHNDVLSATPSTNAEKQSLIEELKRRGRASVTTKRYPDAKDLYTKAIDTLHTITTTTTTTDNNNNQELAILFSNRSLCHLQMNNISESYDDALNATCYDTTYLKGFWRLGQASMALKKTEEALIAYEKALSLDKDNKALKKECDKVKVQLEKEKKEAEEAEEEAEKERAKRKENDEEGGEEEKKDEVKVSTTTTSSTKSNEKDKKEVISSSTEKGEFTKSDHVRGYKIVNGKKTSFFHHEQTEEEKRLIGDITPQRIDLTQLPQGSTTTTGPNNNNNNNNNKIEEKSSSGTSAWNKAGTWEEKDVTDWAIQSIQDKVSQCEFNLPESSADPNAHVNVIKISKLISSKVAGGTCHASVATVRGKKRFIFEFSICVHWEMTLGDGRKCKGEMTFLDVDGTHELGEGYDVTDYNVDSDTPPDAKYLLERFVRDGGLRNVIEKAMDEWIQLFRETYN